MAVATQENKVVGQMLSSSITANLYFHLIYIRTRTRTEGLYAPDAEQNAIFPLLLRSITIHATQTTLLLHRVLLNEQKMLGYWEFRKLGYVPIAWQEIHNSLHSKLPKSDSQTNKLL